VLHVDNVPNQILGQVEQKIMKLIADNDDLLVEGITSGEVGILVSDLLEQSQYLQS
jgi:hypothetical protein